MAWRDLIPKFTNLIGIDLGTARTRVWADSKGVVIDQPTRIAVNSTGKVVAIGQDAAEIHGRVIEDVVVHQPVQRGKLFDARIAKAMLRVWLQEILGAQYVFSPVIMVSIPAGATSADHQAITELLYELGAREAYTIAQPLAAAIGAGVPIADASGTLLFQMGAGVLEVAMISLGSIVASESDWRAGEYVDQRIQQQVKQTLGIRISQQAADQLKQTAPVFVHDKQLTQTVVGQRVSTNAPTELELSLTTISESLQKVAQLYLQQIQRLLAKVPPELTSDVLDKGILLGGGLARLKGFDEWLTHELGVPVSVLEESDKVVVHGIAQAIEHRDEFKQSLGYR